MEVTKWDSGNEINEINYVNIKSEEYKKRSRGQGVDWVIVCDCDEFIYHENLLDKLNEYKQLGITVPRIDGHDMVSTEFPKYDGELITTKIKTGSQTYEPMCKNIIFHPDLDIKYGIGGHSFNSADGKFSDRETPKSVLDKLQSSNLQFNAFYISSDGYKFPIFPASLRKDFNWGSIKMSYDALGQMKTGMIHITVPISN